MCLSQYKQGIGIDLPLKYIMVFTLISTLAGVFSPVGVPYICNRILNKLKTLKQ